MALKQESTGTVLACDGCGRTDAGPSQALAIESYVVNDPNVGSAVQHHYCAGCAANRGLIDPAADIAGWERSATPTPAEEQPAEK